MHICFLCNEYPPGLHGGIGSQFQVLGRGLAARGHQVTVLGVYRRRQDTIEEDRGVRVIRLAHTVVPKAGFLMNGRRIRQALAEIERRNHIDLIDGTELSLAMVPRSWPAPKIIRMNGGHHFFAATLGKRPQPWRSWLERRSFACADHLCGVSRFVAETTRGLLDLGTRPIEILPIPIDTRMFQPRRDIPETPGLIVFVGTICEKKGVPQLLQAMSEVARAVPDAHLWLLGRDYKDENGVGYLEQYRQLVPAAMQNRILFKGPIEHDELPDLLARAQVCVYPSHMEAQGIVNLEAMAMGKAVVSSLAGPGPEILQDGVSGLLCDPHDPASIAERIIRLMRDGELRRRIEGEARRWVVEQFSENVLIERNELFHLRCLAHGVMRRVRSVVSAPLPSESATAGTSGSSAAGNR